MRNTDWIEGLVVYAGELSPMFARILHISYLIDFSDLNNVANSYDLPPMFARMPHM